METFEQIWDTSRINSWSWAYPVVLWTGIGALIAFSLLRNRWLRRSAKVVAILGFSLAATAYSAREIQEKWRIRGEWADTHPGRMTDDSRDALTRDGANLTIGPIVRGLQAFIVFIAVTGILAVVRIVVTRKQLLKPARDGCDGTAAARSPLVSDKPYHPPQDAT
jgi:predicted phage tail protein